MDVLRYSAVQAEAVLTTAVNERSVCLPLRQSCLDTKTLEFATVSTKAANLDAASICWVQCREPILLRRPNETSQWAFIPGLTGASQGFKVCNTAAQFNCGFCCAWTVPNGITRARFQLWGAGGMSGAGCCCGGSPFGSTGAYASVIIPVTAGCVYTICSGCAFCCFASTTSGSQRIPGCPSWVQGPGLTNFCANGGQGSLGTWMAQMGRNNTNSCQISNPNWNCGARICNAGGDFCSASSCSETNGIIGYVAGATYSGNANESIVYGIRGMWPRFRLTSANYGCQQHPPIYGFEGSSQCFPTYTSGNCCGYFCRAACNVLQVPGAGGFYTHAMGGGNGLCGDMGRMGMVCVTFC